MQARGVWLLLLLSSGCLGTSIRVFTKPQTLYLSCLGAPQVGSISWMYSVVCFYHIACILIYLEDFELS